MSRLFETILIRNGKPVNLCYHQKRFDETRKHFWNAGPIELVNVIPSMISRIDINYRCRIEYDQDIRKVSLEEFIPRQIKTLRIIKSDDIEYSFKYADRSHLDSLLGTSDGMDDILIIKKGHVTDTSNANIVFSDGRNNFTPASPLLKGTQRSLLIDHELVREEEILAADIQNFKYWQHINAMNPFLESRYNPVSRIYPQH